MNEEKDFHERLAELEWSQWDTYLSEPELKIDQSLFSPRGSPASWVLLFKKQARLKKITLSVQIEVFDRVFGVQSETPGTVQPDEPASEPSDPGDEKSPRIKALLIHGIRDDGRWQNRIVETLESGGIEIVRPLKYGRISALQFLLPGPFRKKPKKLLNRLIRSNLANQTGHDCVVVIAHSFGTHLISEILLENPEIRIDRMVFCGAVVRADFPWDRMPNAPLILNECGTRDIWPLLADSVTWGYGSTGTTGMAGFENVYERYHNKRHGDYFAPDFVGKEWVRFLRDGIIPKSDSGKAVDTSFVYTLVASFKIKWVLLFLFVAYLVRVVIGKFL